MKLLILIALGLCQAVLGQFGGRSQCDMRRLSQAITQKSQCLESVADLMEEGMQAIQRSDPTCNQGMAETCKKCRDPAKMFAQQNDVDAQGVMECCFQGRLGGFGGSNRQCEFMSKPMMDMGHKGGHGKHGHGPPRRGPPGRGPPGEDDEDMMKKMITLGGVTAMSMGKMAKETCKKLKWCKNEDRMINSRAIPTAKEYGDKITAKLFECYAPMMEVATNCTDIQGEDIECMMKGWSFNMAYREACMKACAPQSLSAFCNMAMNIQGNGNSMQMSRSTNNNNNDFYDPFSFSSGR